MVRYIIYSIKQQQADRGWIYENDKAISAMYTKYWKMDKKPCRFNQHRRDIRMLWWMTGKSRTKEGSLSIKKKGKKWETIGIKNKKRQSWQEQSSELY